MTAVAALASTVIGCERKSATALPDAGAFVGPPRAYDAFGDEARRVDPSAFPTGEVGLAKGRPIAPVDRKVIMLWSEEEQRELDKGGQIAHLMRSLVSTKSPYCPGNVFTLCVGRPWFATDPKSAGVVVYIERRIARAGTYFATGTAVASAYDGVFQFDAVLMPEKVRVARWWRRVFAPTSQTSYGLGFGFRTPTQSPESFEQDMSKIFEGQAPESDFRAPPWDEPVKDAGAAQLVKSAAPRVLTPKRR